jgi:hypothetical protein
VSILFRLIAIVSGALISPGILRAQPPPPQLLPEPPRPIVTDDIYSVTFEWKYPPGDVLFFRLCLQDLGKTCEEPGAIIFDRITATRFQIPRGQAESLRGKHVYWTVFSCDAAGCAAPPSVRHLAWFPPPTGNPPSAPDLVAPPNGSLAPGPDYRVTFRWRPVQQATFYKVCVAEPGIRCGASFSYEWFTTETTTTQALPGRLVRRAAGLRPEGFLHWTVAACDGAGAASRCTYQLNVREVMTGSEPVTFKLVVAPGSSKVLVVPGNGVGRAIEPAQADLSNVSGQGIPGASVCIGETNSVDLYGRATTDGDGRVSFRAAPKKEYQVTASMNGFWAEPCSGLGFCPPYALPQTKQQLNLVLRAGHALGGPLHMFLSDKGALLLWMRESATSETRACP